ncbi:NAD-dependent epimerase/dehydratase family protein [Amycolatopsis saalfeldensis]|uniref:Reductase VcaE n=1 Tax=Amycolatopsis saalfeldensis TaxID=394193 RepID=A0A1H8YJK0_9PSEU|nr:NAD-dependent epimerase/dehydratase family protein [Amycolatopsis saalfeldensis]SEP52384.1 reductase VcaE [Amycolatopsis saalfeldensis]
MGQEPDVERPRVTVLGASGFVGSAVTAALARRDIRLRLVARRPAAGPAGAVAKIETCTADLTAPGAVAAAVEGADAVINLVLHESGWRGAGDPAGEGTNVGVLRDLVVALRHGGRPAPVVVFAGSTSQIGVPPRVPIDGTETDHPVTAYDRQKQAGEELLRAETRSGALSGITLRLPTVFGPGPTPAAQDRGVVAAMTRRALAGQPLTLWGNGSVQRDLLYVDDAGAAFAAALDRPETLAGRHWLLGSGRGIDLRELFGTIAEVVAERTGRPKVPVVSVPAPAGATVTDAHSLVADSSAFRSVTGWCPRVSLREALGRTVAALADPAGARRG